MIKHVNEKDSHLWDVVDVNTGKRIDGVQWANDETGNYEVIIFDKNKISKNCICPNCGDNHVLTKIKKGYIQIVRKSKEE